MGTVLGSLKPYALDAYIGVLARQTMDTHAAAAGNQDLILFFAFLAILAVGTFATQLATEALDEVAEELKGEELGPEGEIEEEPMFSFVPDTVQEKIDLWDGELLKGEAYVVAKEWDVLLSGDLDDLSHKGDLSWERVVPSTFIREFGWPKFMQDLAWS